MKQDFIKLINYPWMQRLFSAAVLGTACYIGSMTAINKDIENLQSSQGSLKEAVNSLRQQVTVLENEQARDIVFRESGERFSQTHGKDLELRSRDYTDMSIREAVGDIKLANAEIKGMINNLGLKLDKYIQLQLERN